MPGDIVVLDAGTLVPADLRLIATKDFFVSQSALTGESMPVEKSAGRRARGHKAALELPNACFQGSNVLSGTARGVVVNTGARTYFGAITRKLAGQRSQTSFDRGIAGFTWLMIRFMVVMVAVVFLIIGLTKHNWIDALLFGLAVAVGLTPEMLPMIVTVNLAKGALAMSQEEGHRQAPELHPELRRHRHPVHRQDRHPHAGPGRPGEARGRHRASRATRCCATPT